MRTPSLSHNDAAPSTSARRIDETVHAMARLLEANANRALAGLTSEIDAATRELAEAFDTQKGRVDGLQQTIETGHLRQDIDRINLVLARLSENIQNHLGEAEQKIDALVHRLTSLSGTVELTRDEARQTTIAAAEKLDSVESRLHLTEASAAHWPQIEAAIEGLSHRVGGIDDIQRTVAELGHWHSQTTNKIVSLSQGLEKIVAGVAEIHEDTRRREVSIENQLNLIYFRKTSPIWEWLQRTKAGCRLI